MSAVTNWATHFRYAEGLRTRADVERDIALKRRCQELDSGGAQCTADIHPSHEHRYSPDDLPGYDPTEF